MNTIPFSDDSAGTPVNTIYCIGRNYVEHARELGNNPPETPLVFLKPNSALLFDKDSIRIPKESSNVHHEVELVAAVEKGGKNISKQEALSHIGGYYLGIDVTARDIQQKAKDNGHPWTIAKGYDTFAPLSNFVNADKIDDPQNLELQLSLNGDIRQSANTQLMIFPITDLVSYLSTIFRLQPGDLIFSGTPAGVSAIKSGDRIEATLGNHLAELNLGVK